MSGPAKAFWFTLPLGRDVKLLTSDANGLAAFAKPAGILSHPNEPRDEPRCLLTARYVSGGEYYEWTPVSPESAPDAAPSAAPSAGRAPGSVGEKGKAGAKPGAAPKVARLWLLNRLDSATSGVILAAASEELAEEVRAMFLKRQVRKVYNALVFGIPTASEQNWHDRLAVDKRGGRVRAETAGNIPAEAHVRVLRARRGKDVSLALIQLEPKTGRSHQLRVQCAKRHLPIVGDATYGDFQANRDFAKATGEKRLFLHSRETSFEYEFRKRTYRFAAQAELPPEFVAMC